MPRVVVASGERFMEVREGGVDDCDAPVKSTSLLIFLLTPSHHCFLSQPKSPVIEASSLRHHRAVSMSPRLRW